MISDDEDALAQVFGDVGGWISGPSLDAGRLDARQLGGPRFGVYRMSLVSFPVFFQSKRYRGSVGSAAVRDFRGAMAGRGDKGLLITTGTFTSEAKAEAPATGHRQWT